MLCRLEYFLNRDPAILPLRRPLIMPSITSKEDAWRGSVSKWRRKKLHIIIYNKQIEGKSTDESSPHYIYIYIHIIFTFCLNPLKSKLGNITVDVSNSELSRKRHNIRVEINVPFCYFQKQWRLNFLQAMDIYSNVQTQAKLVCIMYNMFMLIMLDWCVTTQQSCFVSVNC